MEMYLSVLTQNIFSQIDLRENSVDRPTSKMSLDDVVDVIMDEDRKFVDCC